MKHILCSFAAAFPAVIAAPAVVSQNLQVPVVYGANYFTCDGSSDVAPGLQAAENARQILGAVLVLPAGICRIVSATITVKGPGKWVGAGSQSFTTSLGTIIRDARTTGDTLAVISHDGVAFEDFRIDVEKL